MIQTLSSLLWVGFFLQAEPAPSSKLHPTLKNTSTTRCAECHTTASWAQVSYDHDRTGYPLVGAHLKAPCAGCHRSDFRKATPKQCVACHVDVHGGELGARCENCHTEKDWQSQFTADAHRRTNFPLAGRHALLPCESCHAEAASKRFTRATVECFACHSSDYDRANVTSIKHASKVPPLETNCRQCHNVLRWSPARYPDHEQNAPGNFDISPSSPHAAMACRDCHDQKDSLRDAALANAKCTACHSHSREITNAQHLPGPILGMNVNGYVYLDLNCAACHITGSYP